MAYFELNERLAARLRQPAKVVLTTHVRPDGDAVGSTLGLMHWLRAQGHDARVTFSTPVPDYLQWMPGLEHTLDAEANRDECLALLAQADVVGCLDYGVLDRVGGDLEPAVRAAKVRGALILHLDHHLDLEDFADVLCRDVKSSSTCELVYRLIRTYEPGYVFTKEAATVLYTGIMTDTGSFRFDSTTPAVHRAAAELIEAGVEVGKVHHRTFSEFTEMRTRFLGFCLSERLRVLPELRTAYITVTHADHERFQLRPGDTEGIVNYALGIRGTNFGIILIEKHGEIKMSFRSVGRFSAQAFAGNFNGGGHYNAAGGRSSLSLAETEARLVALLEQHKQELQYEHE